LGNLSNLSEIDLACNLLTIPSEQSLIDFIDTRPSSLSQNEWKNTQDGSCPSSSTPLSPTDINATVASQTQINLSWTDNSSDETGFKVERNGALIQTVAANVTMDNDTGLSCGTTYNYSVKATNANGDSTAITASATTAACPSTTSPTSAPNTPSFAVSSPIMCTIDDNVSSSCHAGGKTFTKEVEVGENISISHAKFAKDVKNNGMISNSTIGTDATLTGGKLTGNIINEGTIVDINFVGAKLEGGTLSGNIVNNSKVGGSIQDILLAPNTSITGGILKKTIIGDPLYPAFLEELTVFSGSHLDNVIIGRHVELAKNVSMGAGVEFFTRGVSINKPGQFLSTQSDFWGNIRADEKRHANGVKLTRRLASTLQIEERLFVETKHVGQSAELLIVAYHKTVSKTTAYMRVGESWKAWNGEIAHLEAATQYEHLPKKMEVPVFEGDLSELLGEFTVYSGYRLETEQSIIFNGDSPLKFSVEK
jgi:hypothetical protein